MSSPDSGMQHVWVCTASCYHGKLLLQAGETHGLGLPASCLLGRCSCKLGGPLVCLLYTLASFTQPGRLVYRVLPCLRLQGCCRRL